MRTTIVLILTALIFVSSCSTAYALEENVGFSRIDPSSPIYFLKTIRENLELKFAGTIKIQMIRNLEFATRRLRESKSLLGTNQEILIWPTLERYWYSFNTVLNFRPRDEDLTLLINHIIKVHVKEFISLYDKLKDPKAKLALRTTINRLMQGSDVTEEARELGCNFLLKESSSSALNQSERVIYKERAISCLKIH